MSSDFQNELNQATDAINAGRFGDALNIARNILVTDPSQAQAKLIEAISLSQQGNRSDASEAFRRAVELNPGDAKTRFNAAVHEFNAGNADEAREYANAALAIEPSHKGSKELLERMPKTVGADGFSGYSRESSADYQPQAEGLPFIKKLGSKWTLIGWLLSGLGLTMFILSLISILPMVGEMTSAMSSGNQEQIAKMQSAQNPVLTVLGYPVTFAILIYMILDLVHRKGNMLWLIAHIPCSCCGLGFVTLPIYLLTGRK